MYKRFSIDDLEKIQNNFFANLAQTIKKEKCQLLTDFCKHGFKDGNQLHYFNRGYPAFSFCKDGDTLTLIDEKDKIEVIANIDEQRKINSLLRRYLTRGKKMHKDQQSIENILMEQFTNGGLTTVNDKPYLIYDIETSMANDIRQFKFWIAYAMQPHNNKTQYKYVDQTNLEKFAQTLLDFDGYIVGYNNIAFDNPVVIHNVGGTQADIEKINHKSIDLYLFLLGMTGKRMGLNKVATALTGTAKTQESGAEAGKLYEQYLETGNEKLLNEFKKYCKNDVKMTTLVFFYLLYYQKIFIDGEEITFTIDDLIDKGSTAPVSDDKPTHQAMFTA